LPAGLLLLLLLPPVHLGGTLARREMSICSLVDLSFIPAGMPPPGEADQASVSCAWTAY
jgi:hypothetical protein